MLVFRSCGGFLTLGTGCWLPIYPSCLCLCVCVHEAKPGTPSKVGFLITEVDTETKVPEPAFPSDLYRSAALCSQAFRVAGMP